MTNEIIIFENSLHLMESGKIKGTGQFCEIEYEDGSKKTVEIPEDIHTFNGWKSLGYSVKKGEHAIASFPIWKHTTKSADENTGDENLDALNAEINRQGGHEKMFMKTAFFFTQDQVEPLDQEKEARIQAARAARREKKKVG